VSRTDFRVSSDRRMDGQICNLLLSLTAADQNETAAVAVATTTKRSTWLNFELSDATSPSTTYALSYRSQSPQGEFGGCVSTTRREESLLSRPRPCQG